MPLRHLVLVFAVFSLSGCLTIFDTRYENFYPAIPIPQEKWDAARIRHYSGVTKEKFTAAVRDALNSSFGKRESVRFTETPGSLVGEYAWLHSGSLDGVPEWSGYGEQPTGDGFGGRGTLRHEARGRRRGEERSR